MTTKPPRSALHAFVRTAAAAALLAHGAAALALDIAPLPADPTGLRALPAHVGGRVVAQADGSLLRQWPGTYFEAAFEGEALYFRIGPGQVSLRVGADAEPAAALVKPAPGLYRVSGFQRGGAHLLRITVASESQAGPTVFGGFLLGPGATPAPLPHRSRQIEFIGDSHTVGYGNTSKSRDCSADEVWATTDSSRGVAALVAARYDADYAAHAISGRGVVRNVGGFLADTLPQAYPFALFDKRQAADDAAWKPRVIVISLGTNDFLGDLRAGERWTTREQLRADYEATYARFIADLQRRYPEAYLVLWTVEGEGSELRTEVTRVFEQVRRSAHPRIGLVAVSGLDALGCHYHPSIADDRRIADALIQHLDAQAGLWPAAAAR